MTGRELRADARRKREQIIDAARALIAERGAAVRMDDVARAAGVGSGTLYRRFPDREELIRGVALDSFARVVERARTAEDEEPDAWRGLTRFLREAAADLRLASWMSIWFAETWARLRVDEDNQRMRASLLKILDRLVRGAQHDGALRADITVEDLTMMLALLLRPIPDLPTPLTPQDVERYLGFMIDGLRA
ncbi:TetR/AcrR family transcriptional regulator [Allokutzneria sp. A3M-2-11 16]|uniref:TetR/AcrR family transcriptional regulator n=1 Tax=Allokutzneria sp. A3M-2-11 16 TaxID=2962043 RepID=UPI0020B66993|nr:TetR/AcrR family transcriptional regulator [Allokutzneria sp. A3M-2-11 16]MCP3802933.1 TetR/AcrR family transcriptional regulator [Allokutzneria sp. A3M-2-11 16]